VSTEKNKNYWRKPRRADSIEASSTQRPRRIFELDLKLVAAAH
jgi:hypothetical protein